MYLVFCEAITESGLEPICFTWDLKDLKIWRKFKKLSFFKITNTLTLLFIKLTYLGIFFDLIVLFALAW